ncbi:MAG: (d)CMP kinase [Candidatus Woesearchaeota archaeon]
MIITIGGTPGAGKDTVGRILSKKVNYKYYSFGELLREIALKEGIGIEELTSKIIQNPITDNQVDEYQEELGSTMDNIIIVSRLGFHFIPHSLKVYLHCDEKEAARRIVEDSRSTESIDSVEDAVELIRKRNDNDAKRYKKFYGLDIHERTKYDIVINTTLISADDTAQIIITMIEAYKKKEDRTMKGWKD